MTTIYTHGSASRSQLLEWEPGLAALAELGDDPAQRVLDACDYGAPVAIIGLPAGFQASGNPVTDVAMLLTQGLEFAVVELEDNEDYLQNMGDDPWLPPTENTDAFLRYLGRIRRGRPPLDDSERTKLRSIRLSDADYAELQRRGMDALREWLRTAVKRG